MRIMTPLAKIGKIAPAVRVPRPNRRTEYRDERGCLDANHAGDSHEQNHLEANADQAAMEAGQVGSKRLDSVVSAYMQHAIDQPHAPQPA